MNMKTVLYKYPHQHKVIVAKVAESDIPEIKQVVKNAFTGLDFSSVEPYIDENANWRLSFKATINGMIVGCYILSDRGIEAASDGMTLLEDISPYKNKRGIEGLSFAVLPQHQNSGIGKMLKQAIIGYDFIFGLQYKSLANLKYWLKTRRLVAEDDEAYLTLHDF